MHAPHPITPANGGVLLDPLELKDKLRERERRDSNPMTLRPPLQWEPVIKMQAL